MIVSIRQQFEHLFSGDIMKADKAADCSAAFLSACAGMALPEPLRRLGRVVWQAALAQKAGHCLPWHACGGVKPLRIQPHLGGYEAVCRLTLM